MSWGRLTPLYRLLTASLQAVYRLAAVFLGPIWWLLAAVSAQLVGVRAAVGALVAGGKAVAKAAPSAAMAAEAASKPAGKLRQVADWLFFSSPRLQKVIDRVFRINRTVEGFKKIHQDCYEQERGDRGDRGERGETAAHGTEEDEHGGGGGGGERALDGGEEAGTVRPLESPGGQVGSRTASCFDEFESPNPVPRNVAAAAAGGGGGGGSGGGAVAATTGAARSFEQGQRERSFDFDFECPTPEHELHGTGELLKRSGLWQRVAKRENEAAASPGRAKRMGEAREEVRRATRGLGEGHTVWR